MAPTSSSADVTPPASRCASSATRPNTRRTIGRGRTSATQRCNGWRRTGFSMPAASVSAATRCFSNRRATTRLRASEQLAAPTSSTISRKSSSSRHFRHTCKKCCTHPMRRRVRRPTRWSCRAGVPSVTISSTTAPDLQSICRSAIGCDVISAEPIGAGNNSRVFRVALDGSPECRRHVVVKFYRRDAGDARDRLTTEFESLRFLWQNNVRSIPCPIAIAHDRRCAIYEYVDGDAAGSAPPNAIDVDASVAFLRLLKQLRGAPGSHALPAASEACFSVDAIVASVAGRAERLRRAPDDDHGARMHRWLDDVFAPFEAEAVGWARVAAAAAGIAFDAALAVEARTLSPSDFGLHNAVRRPDGRLGFVGFDYFGLDVQHKAIRDYLI